MKSGMPSQKLTAQSLIEGSITGTGLEDYRTFLNLEGGEMAGAILKTPTISKPWRNTIPSKRWIWIVWRSGSQFKSWWDWL